MLIIIGKDGSAALPQGCVIGHVGENKLRKHTVMHPEFENAEYRLIIRNSANSISIPMTDDEVVIPKSALAYAGEAYAQFKAVIYGSGNTESEVFMSEIFRVEIGDDLITSSAFDTEQDAEQVLRQLREEISKGELNSDSARFSVSGVVAEAYNAIDPNAGTGVTS